MTSEELEKLTCPFCAAKANMIEALADVSKKFQWYLCNSCSKVFRLEKQI